MRRDADALSHVIFTSGSTGRPKGVIITHANVLALLDWVHDIYREDELAAVLASTSVSFDISVFEIWAPLDVGGTIVLVENATELCARSFDDLTLINTVPSALRFLVEEGAIPPSVRIVNVAGEPLDKQLVNDLFARHRALALYNLYGPTEDTTYSTWFRMNGPVATDPPIGTPIAHSYGRILDERGHSVPVGAIGELHLGGAGVSRGYLGRPDLTAERFLRRSADHGERSEYRTGDLVRLGNDGALRYVGRAGTQVKLRGFRIELGEIEHALRHTDGIADACALVKRYQSGDAIVAYLIPAAARAANAGDLPAEAESELRARLPDYMVPAVFVVLDSLPLNASGKVDRRALLKHDVAIAAADPAVGPRDDVERTIVEIWKAVLKRNRIGIHDDFFRLGGNSLLAIQMVSRVNKTFGSSLAGTLAFECKTVALLAARLDADAGQVLPLERVETSGRVIASYPQQGAWPIANQDAFKTFYNMVNGLWLDGPLDAEALQRSLDRLIARHESLRAHFALAGDDVMMCVSPTITIPIERRDLAAGDDLRASARNEIARECAREFDLMRAPLVRASLFRRSPTQHLFILTIHHLVSDAWSNNLIQKELGAFYADEVGAEARLPSALSIHYTDYAYWYARWHETEPYRRQIDYWRRKLAAMAVSEHPFPTDTGAVQAPGPMCYLDIDIAGERYAAITAFARERGITIYVVLMSALHLALLAYSGLSEFMIYSPLAGRPREELEASVGLYVNMIVVVSKTDESATIGDFVRQIGDNIIEAHANSAVSMMAMMRRLEAPLPALPSVVLNVIDLPNTAGWTLPGITVEPLEPERDGAIALTGLDVVARMRQGGADVCLGYNTAPFRAESGGRLAALFADAIESIVRAPASGLGAWLASQRR